MATVSERRYLSIGEVLAQLQEEFPDVTISKIRFLESQGLIDPERTPSGYRKFYDADIERLRFILHEQKEHFLPLKVIRDRLDGEGDQPAEPSPPPFAPSITASHPSAGATHGAPTPAPAPSSPPTLTAVPRPADEPEPPARVPIWMQKAAANTAPRVASVAADATSVSLTFEELARACGLTEEELRQVEQFGLIAGRPVGRTTFYDDDALIVAKLAAGFLRHGIEPRHLKIYKHAAEREAGLFEQVILPLVKQRNPQARGQALETLQSLSRLGGDLREAMLRQAVRPYTDGA